MTSLRSVRPRDAPGVPSDGIDTVPLLMVPPLNRNVQVRLSEADYIALKAIADREGLRIALVIRLLLRWTLGLTGELEDEDRPLDAAEFIHALVVADRAS